MLSEIKGDGKPIILSEMKEMVKITEKVTRRRVSHSLQALQGNCEGHTRGLHLGELYP
jgi:hypothetical protein